MDIRYHSGTKKKPFFLKKNRPKYKYQSHPRCDEFEIAFLKTSPRNQEVIFNTRYEKMLSYNTMSRIKKIKCCSYYYAIDSLLRIGNLAEQNFLVKILDSAISYVHTNYDTGFKKLWIEKFNVETYSNVNRPIRLNSSAQYLQFSSYVTIKLGFIPDSKVKVRMRRGKNFKRK